MTVTELVELVFSAAEPIDADSPHLLVVAFEPYTNEIHIKATADPRTLLALASSFAARHNYTIDPAPGVREGGN